MGGVGWKPENLARKTHRRALPPKQLTSFGVSFWALSGASADASEEVSSSATPMSGKERKLLGRRGYGLFAWDVGLKTRARD